MKKNKIKEIVFEPMKINELLKNNKVHIPVLQRDYAQGREEKAYIRKSMLSSINMVLEGDKNKLPMYLIYGYQDKDSINKFFPLDGQQRLTTLWLIYWYFALRAEKLEEEKADLLNFSYETRKSSRKFCHALCEEITGNIPKKGIVEYIENQTWFLEEWKQDPTINSMLRMIGGTENEDGIETVWGNRYTNTFIKYLKNFKNNILFYRFTLNSDEMPKESADRLYVKMNARGKALTDFEDFKSALLDELRKNKKFKNKKIGKENIDDYISQKLDGDWNDIFWEALDAGKNGGKTDEVFFAFIHRFLLNQLIVESKEVDDGNGKTINKFVIEAENVRFIKAIKDPTIKVPSKNEDRVKNIRDDKNKKKDLLLYDYLNNDTQISYTEYDWYKKIITEGNLNKFDLVMKGLREHWKDVEGVFCEINKIVAQRSNKEMDSTDADDEEDSDGSVAANAVDDEESDIEVISESSFIPVYDRDKKNDIIYHEDKSGNQVRSIKEMSLKGRAYFFAACRYFEKNTDFDKCLFFDWMRVARNIIENSGVDAAPAMISVVRKLYELSEGSSNIYEYLKNLDNIEGNTKLDNQVNEEIEKAKRIVNHPDDKKNIQEAEDLLFLCGCIRFLFRNENGINAWDHFLDKKSRFCDCFKSDENILKLSKDYASSFKKFEGIAEIERMIFHTNGWQSRGDSWLDILCGEDYEIVHNILMGNPQKVCDDSYESFVNSKAFEMLVLKNDGIMINTNSKGKTSERKEKQNLRICEYNGKYALYKKMQREEKMYFDDQNFKRNKLLFALAQKGIEIKENHIFDKGEAYYWGEDIVFGKSGKTYRWNIKDEIYEVKRDNPSVVLGKMPKVQNASILDADAIWGKLS